MTKDWRDYFGERAVSIKPYEGAAWYVAPDKRAALREILLKALKESIRDEAYLAGAGGHLERSLAARRSTAFWPLTIDDEMAHFVDDRFARIVSEHQAYFDSHDFVQSDKVRFVCGGLQTIVRFEAP